MGSVLEGFHGFEFFPAIKISMSLAGGNDRRDARDGPQRSMCSYRSARVDGWMTRKRWSRFLILRFVGEFGQVLLLWLRDATAGHRRLR